MVIHCREGSQGERMQGGEAWKGTGGEDAGRGRQARGRQGGRDRVGGGGGREGGNALTVRQCWGYCFLDSLCQQSLDSQYLSPDRPRNKETDSNDRGLFT